MATYIKTLKEDNGDITYPQTKAEGVLLNNGSDLETELSQYVTAEDIASTSALTPPVQTNMIADYAVTDEKIDWTSFDSSEWPIVNDNATNANINSNQYYNQYQYEVPTDGVYIMLFSQRMTNGENNRDLAMRITVNNTDTYCNTFTGGSTWVNWIPGIVFAIVELSAGDTVRFQCSGGGTGSYTTQNGKVSIARIR